MPPAILILGNGGAAVHAVMAARTAGYRGTVHLVSDTPGPAFNPMLSPYFLAGEIPFDDCFPFGDTVYERHEVTRHSGSPIVSLDAFEKVVQLDNGERLQYDRCLVATGSRPLMPPVPGLSESNTVFTLRTPQDTLRLGEALSSAGHALILGASMIGIKLADILMNRGFKVTLADVERQVMSGAAHPLCASILEEEIRKSGVDLRLGWSMEGVEDVGKGICCYFRGQSPLETDLCLVTTGVKANMDFLDPRQVATDRGILVDERMLTSAQDLYAAGDVSQGCNPLSGKQEIIGLWGNACLQGRNAGTNMAGVHRVYPGTIPHHVSLFFGLTFVHLGDITRQGEEVKVIANPALSQGRYHLLVFKGDVLIGVNTINSFQNAGALKSAIQQKLSWSGYIDPRIENPQTWEMDRILASLRNSLF